MDHAIQATLHQTIRDVLEELGVVDPRFAITDTTVLVQDGCYVGRSLTCDHVRVVMLPGGSRIEFHDHDGRLLRAICLSETLVQSRAA